MTQSTGRTANPRPAPSIRKPLRKPDARFHMMLGLAGALGLLAVVATVVLFVRETKPSPAATSPAPSATTPTAPAVETAPAPPQPPPAVAEPEPEVKRNARATTPRRLTKVAAAERFTGTVWLPTDKPAVTAEPVATEASESSEPQKATEPKLAADTPQDKPETAPVEPATVDIETKSVGKIKKVFGSLLRPFRGGARKDAKKAANPGSAQ